MIELLLEQLLMKKQTEHGKQMNATTTISIPSSHASLVSHPNEIAQLILNTTKGIAK